MKTIIVLPISKLNIARNLIPFPIFVSDHYLTGLLMFHHIGLS